MVGSRRAHAPPLPFFAVAAVRSSASPTAIARPCRRQWWWGKCNLKPARMKCALQVVLPTEWLDLSDRPAASIVFRFTLGPASSRTSVDALVAPSRTLPTLVFTDVQEGLGCERLTRWFMSEDVAVAWGRAAVVQHHSLRGAAWWGGDGASSVAACDACRNSWVGKIGDGGRRWGGSG